MKARSNLKVIVCSGYSIDGPAREILDEGAQDFIQKPFFDCHIVGETEGGFRGEINLRISRFL